MVDWLIERLTGRLNDWLSEWRTDWLIDDWLNVCLIDWMIDWVTDWLTVWLTDWLIDWLVEWSIDWLIDCMIYRTVRQEMSILLPLRHQNVVSLLGYCLNPFCMILEFAPQGALDQVLANYKRAGVRLNAYVMQKCIVQVFTFYIWTCGAFETRIWMLKMLRIPLVGILDLVDRNLHPNIHLSARRTGFECKCEAFQWKENDFFLFSCE